MKWIIIKKKSLEKGLASISILFAHTLCSPRTPTVVGEPRYSDLSRYLSPWNLSFSHASDFFCLRHHQILTILHILGDPPFSSFDYTALHIKGTQLLEVKWLNVAVCQSMLMKQPSPTPTGQPVHASRGLQETLLQCPDIKVIVKRGGQDKVKWASTQGRWFGRKILQ